MFCTETFDRSTVEARDAEGLTSKSHRKFWGEAKLIRFGQIWLDLGEIWAKVIKICANLIRFGQNQNLASSKTFNLLRPYLTVKTESRLMPGYV